MQHLRNWSLTLSAIVLLMHTLGTSDRFALDIQEQCLAVMGILSHQSDDTVCSGYDPSVKDLARNFLDIHDRCAWFAGRWDQGQSAEMRTTADLLLAEIDVSGETLASATNDLDVIPENVPPKGNQLIPHDEAGKITDWAKRTEKIRDWAKAEKITDWADASRELTAKVLNELGITAEDLMAEGIQFTPDDEAEKIHAQRTPRGLTTNTSLLRDPRGDARGSDRALSSI